MTSQENISVSIATGIDPTFLTDTLTTDIDLNYALFDAIDNSIDAARNALSVRKYKKDRFGLPESYLGYAIILRFSNDKIIIKDNCLGIEKEILINKAFFTGKKSNHDFGIGHYGLGLKRALLKAGSEFSSITDNGTNAYKSQFNADNLSGRKAITAIEYTSQNKPKTVFIVSKIHEEVRAQIIDKNWLQMLSDNINVRYASFLRKGLKIELRASFDDYCLRFVAKPGTPDIRKTPLMNALHDFIEIDGVKAHFTIGIHEKYRFKGEKDYHNPTNSSITNEYGLYFICNDRVIVAGTQENKYGFTTKWHSEYSGFVCLINIISEDPQKLPWNTPKTELKTNSSTFRRIKEKILPLASKYRSEAKKVLNVWLDRTTKSKSEEERKDIFAKHFRLPEPTQSGAEKDLADSKLGDTGSKEQSTPKPKESNQPDIDRKPNTPEIIDNSSGSKKQAKAKNDLPRDRDEFIDWSKCTIEIPESHLKVYSILEEMRYLSSKKHPIICTVMLRVLLEDTAKTILKLMELEPQSLAKNYLRISEKLFSDKYIDGGLKDLIKQYSNSGEAGLFSFSNIQSQIHSTRFHPNQSKVNTTWDELEPVIAICWKYISEKEN